MPYFIRKEGDKHCVVKGEKDNPGETVKCHATHKEALAHLRALYVHVEDAKATASDATANTPHGEGGTLANVPGGDDDKSDCVCPKCGHKVKSEEGTPCPEQCPQCHAQMGGAEAKNLQELIAYAPINARWQTSYKSGDKWRWLAVSNVAVEDKEHEIVSEKAYDDAIAYAHKNNAFGELDLVHVDGTDVGPCDLMTRLGNQLVEGGEWGDDPHSIRARENVQAEPEYWGVSIKFKYDPEQFNDKIYQGGIRILKRTILPRQMAASYGTAIAVHGGAQMKKIDEETKAALSKLGWSDEEIAALVEKQKALPSEENVKVKEEEAKIETESDEKAAMKSESDGKHPAGHYLVVEDAESPSTWHLRVHGTDGKPDHTLMGAAWAALHGGYRGNEYEGPNKDAALTKLRSLYKSESMTPPGEDGKSIQAETEVIEAKAPSGFLASIKGAVQEVLDSFKKTPEPEQLTADVSENSDAELEVESEKEVVQEPVAPIEEKHFVTEELLQAYGTQLAQTIAAVVAEKVAGLALEQEKAKDWRDATEKRIAELAKPIEQRVMDRLGELPPIVKTRVSHLDATAKGQAPGATSQETSYLGELMKSIDAEVKRGQKGDGKVVV